MTLRGKQRITLRNDKRRNDVAAKISLRCYCETGGPLTMQCLSTHTSDHTKILAQQRHAVD